MKVNFWGVFFLVLAWTPVPSSADSLPDFPFIIVDGEATREVPPDQVRINMTLLVFDQNADVALNQLAETSARVMEILHANGVSDDQVEAAQVDKRVEREGERYRPNGEILGYTVYRTMFVELDDLTNFSEIAATLSALDNLTSFHTQFDTAQRTDIQVELQREAVADARVEANLLVEALDVEIDSVYAVAGDRAFRNLRALFEGGNPVTHAAAMSAPAEYSPAVEMYIPDAITLAASVTIVYRISD